MKVRRWLLRLLLVLSLVPVVALGIGCTPVCAATLRAEDSALGKWLDKIEKNNRREGAGEKKSGPWKPEGGPVRGGGVAPKATCKASGGVRPSRFFGSKAEPFASKTIYTRKTGHYTYHLDVENPGNRDASIHVQINSPGDWAKYKFEYNRTTGTFSPDRHSKTIMPNKVKKDLETPEGQRGIDKAYKELGEER